MGFGTGRGSFGGFSGGVSLLMCFLWFDDFDSGKAQFYTHAFAVSIAFVNHTFTERYVASASRAGVHVNFFGFGKISTHSLRNRTNGS